MNWLYGYVLWLTRTPINIPPNETIATEGLPDTVDCSVAHNLHPMFDQISSDGRASYWIVTVVGAVLMICTLPFSFILVFIVMGIADGLRLRAHALALRQGEIARQRPLPPYQEAIIKLHRSEWVGTTASGEVIRERDHIYIGAVQGTAVPCLAHLSQIAENIEVAGPTGSGKDYRVLNSIANQLLARGWRVVKINHKKDDTDVKMHARMAKANGVEYEVFTLSPSRSGRMMNFNEMRHRALVPDATWAQIMVAALGLNLPTLNTGSFHADKALQLILPLIKHCKPKTFQEMLDILHDPTYARRFNFEDYDFKYGNHLVAKLTQAADVLALNLTQETARAEVFEHRIDVCRTLSEPGVTYLDLQADIDGTVAQLTSDSFCLHLLAAANVWSGPRVPVMLIVSDAPKAMGPNLNNALRHCRSFGISMCLAHHTMSDLKVGVNDYSASVAQNCRTRIIFGGADPELVRQMKAISGTVRKKLGTFSPESDGEEPDGLREVEVARIGEQEILDAAMQPGVAIVDLRPHRGFGRFRHPVFVGVGFPVSRATFDKIAADPWPTRPGMFVAADYKQPEPEKLTPRKPVPKKSIGDFARSLREDDD